MNKTHFFCKFDNCYLLFFQIQLLFIVKYIHIEKCVKHKCDLLLRKVLEGFYVTSLAILTTLGVRKATSALCIFSTKPAVGPELEPWHLIFHRL